MRRRVRVVLFLWALTTRNKKRPALGPSLEMRRLGIEPRT